jgi:hypothetical protein
MRGHAPGTFNFFECPWGMATHGLKSAKTGLLAWRAAKQDPPKTGKYALRAQVWVGACAASAGLFVYWKYMKIIVNVRKNIKKTKIEFALKSLGFDYYYYPQLLLNFDRIIVHLDFWHRSGAYTRAVTPHRWCLGSAICKNNRTFYAMVRYPTPSKKLLISWFFCNFLHFSVCQFWAANHIFLFWYGVGGVLFCPSPC